METQNSQIIFSVLSGSLTLAFLSIFIIAAFNLFIKRKKILYEANIKQKEEFEKMILQTEIDIQKNTSQLISEEIHDNISQSLSLINLNISQIESGDEYIDNKLQEAEKLVCQVIGELRNISKILNHEFQNNKSFNSIISNLVEIVNKNGFNVFFEVEGIEREMLPKNKLILFRILQECINNAIKHSEADRCDILMAYYDNKLEISFKDNGKGFDVESAIKGQGLMNMKKKSDFINAQLNIDSKVGFGTSITITAPCLD